MAHYFFSDPPNILPCEGTGIGYKSSKQSYLATSREDIREAHTILAYRFTDSLCSLHVFTPQSISNVLTRRGLLSFLSILVHFPKSKL